MFEEEIKLAKSLGYKMTLREKSARICKEDYFYLIHHIDSKNKEVIYLLDREENNNLIWRYYKEGTGKDGIYYHISFKHNDLLNLILMESN